MTRPRSHVVLKNESRVYHCISRCVRRAYLCGYDTQSETSYDHRRKWVEERIEFLSNMFFIKIYSYAVMNNHYHIVMATDFEQMNEFSDREIVVRWHTLTCKTRDECGNPLRVTEETIEASLKNPDRVLVFRERLCSVSWFMRYLNEWLSRKANREDHCKGRFWEGRFKCQRLDDPGALFTCMNYVDLNPVRAGMVDTPEESEYTSVYKRIRSKQAKINEKAEQEIQDQLRESEELKNLKQKNLKDLHGADFLTPIHEIFQKADANLDGYLELLDFTGRELIDGKRGRIPPHLCGILTRLDLDHENWVDNVQRYGSLFHYYAGKVKDLCDAISELKSKWCWGKRGSVMMYRTE